MTNLYQKLKLGVTNWRQQGYPSSYPAITTILQHNQSNFLRKAQFEALETYWYLRLVKNTPNIFDLYQDYFPGKNLFEAFGLKHLIENLPEDLITPEFTQGILKKIETEVPPTELKTGLMKARLDKIGHAMRNAVLQSIGVQYAVWLNDNRNLNIRTVMAANVGNDFLPHSSIQAYRTMNILVCTDQNNWDWQIGSPFTEPTLKGRPLYKADNIKWAVERNIPLQFTRTCINDCEVPDGTCGECVDRLKAFKEAGIPDSIKYQNQP